MCFDRFTDCLEIYRLFADMKSLIPKGAKSIFYQNGVISMSTYQLHMRI